MIEFDPNISSILPNARPMGPQAANPAAAKADFSRAVKAVGEYISKVDDMQQASDASVQDLLVGRNNDITAVVAAVAKADMSFKVLVGVRNKLIEAYKQTMSMPI
ncbi:MAG: flagellar hook-basal body complex protein FliE [Sedimentisphaerales bacterium]|nr:flagellar hook-basal body complex protein FliE [Sedimentisphaerales bacterium]